MAEFQNMKLKNAQDALKYSLEKNLCSVLLVVSEVLRTFVSDGLLSLR